MKIVVGELRMSVSADCPYCGDFLDLLNYDEYGDIRRAILMGKIDTIETLKIKIKCPKCRKDFLVEDVNY